MFLLQWTYPSLRLQLHPVGLAGSNSIRQFMQLDNAHAPATLSYIITKYLGVIGHKSNEEIHGLKHA